MAVRGYAEVDWSEGGAPISKNYGDIYYNPSHGLEESEYVFVDGIGGPRYWQGKGRFSVGETGFGSGLNFLALWRRWQQTSKAGAILNFMSAECSPMHPDDMARAHAAFPQLADLSRKLLRARPRPGRGFRTVWVEEGKVRLTLMYGDAARMIEEMSGTVDAWFLDGFAPSKNPEMWSDRLFRALAECSTTGCRVASFTAAGAVRRGLQENGFTVERRKGFGWKRECISAVCCGSLTKKSPAPWFDIPDPVDTGQGVSVIGAGIAGSCCARALKNHGLNVSVSEREASIAPHASGNPAGIMRLHPQSGDTPSIRLHEAAYEYAIGFYERLNEPSGLGEGKPVHSKGVVLLPRNRKDIDRFDSVVNDGLFDSDDMAHLSTSDAADLCGFDPGAPAFYLSRSLTLNPLATVRAALGDIPLSTREAGMVDTVTDRESPTVIATGALMRDMAETLSIPMTASRGQITYLDAALSGLSPKCSISAGCYLSPLVDCEGKPGLVLGATYDRWADGLDQPRWEDLKANDHRRNIELWQERSGISVGEHAIFGGRASLRSVVPDRLPVIGPAFDGAYFADAYADIRHGRKEQSFPEARLVKNLYLLSALGSRGFMFAPLAAEIVASMISGLPLPIETSLMQALHPARFLISQLRKG